FEAFASHRLGDTAWNLRGYRGRLLGRKKPNEIRVAAIGGSTTFGFTVRTRETYPAYLETILNERLAARGLTASVANLGHLSDSSVCYEPTYQAYRDLDPDVLILYEGYNDVSGGTRRTERDCYRQSSAIFRAALEPFMTNPRFAFRSFLYLFGGKWDARWFNRMMWLNPQGNHLLAERMADAVMEVLPAEPSPAK